MRAVEGSRRMCLFLGIIPRASSPPHASQDPSVSTGRLSGRSLKRVVFHSSIATGASSSLLLLGFKARSGRQTSPDDFE